MRCRSDCTPEERTKYSVTSSTPKSTISNSAASSSPVSSAASMDRGRNSPSEPVRRKRSASVASKPRLRAEMRWSEPRVMVTSPGDTSMEYGLTSAALAAGESRTEAPWRRNAGPVRKMMRVARPIPATAAVQRKSAARSMRCPPSTARAFSTADSMSPRTSAGDCAAPLAPGSAPASTALRTAALRDGSCSSR